MTNKISIDVLKTRFHIESGYNPAFKNIINISLEKEYVFCGANSSNAEWYDIITISLATSILSDSDLQEIKAVMVSYGYYNYVIKVFESKTGSIQLEIQFISGLFPDFVEDETDFIKGD